ncbi:MAG: molybdopterin dinucleotide binding domain-containing protein, partial [Pseudonocardiaceae bacterium]
VEKTGSYLDWEGRRREFATTIPAGVGATLPDCRVLDSLAVEMDVDLFTQTPAAAWAGLAALGSYAGARLDSPQVPAAPAPQVGDGQVVLATWRRLLDNGSMQDGEPHLAGTARSAVALLSEATAHELGVHLGAEVTVSTRQGSVTLPAAAADLPAGVVWIPGNSGPATVRSSLGVGHGAVVTVRSGDGSSVVGR